MKQGKTEVVFVIDRSGSMETIKQATQEGFNNFIKKQKEEPGECFVSLYQFDTVYEPVFEYKNIKKVNGYDLVPRGCTALIDAIGKTINTLGERLNKTSEFDRPEQVIVVVMTDGWENSSKEFTRKQIKDMVEHQTTKYSWKFFFLGANQDAILVGNSYGFSSDYSITYNATKGSTTAAFAVLNTGVSCLRLSQEFAFSNEMRCQVINA